MSGDLDLVIKGGRDMMATRDGVFQALGLTRIGRHWRHTPYGDQALAMLFAFGEDQDMDWLEPELRREDALDALQELAILSSSDEPVTHERLLALVDRLNPRSTSS
jgi:hypothetical protein